MKKAPVKRTKVAIVGLVATEKTAPFDDESFELWTLNQGIRLFHDRRVDKFFDLHDWDYSNYRPDYYDALYELRLQHRLVDVHDYPYRDIGERYGYLFENSIPMMMLYAGYLDFKDIYVFGIDDGEFNGHDVRMGYALYHAMGALRTEGRRVWLCTQTTLDPHGIYGLDNMRKTEIPNGFVFKERGIL